MFAYEKNFVDSLCLLGANVVSGKGVCRHIASMLTDIYNCMGFESYNLACFLPNDATAMRSQLLKHDKNNSFPEPLLMERLFGFLSIQPLYNHLVTIVNSYEGSLVMDPTNDFLFFARANGNFVSAPNYNTCLRCDIIDLFNEGFVGSLGDVVVPVDLGSLLDVKDRYRRVVSKIPNYSFDRFYERNRGLYGEVVAKKKVLDRELGRYILAKK